MSRYVVLLGIKINTVAAFVVFHYNSRNRILLSELVYFGSSCKLVNLPSLPSYMIFNDLSFAWVRYMSVFACLSKMT